MHQINAKSGKNSGVAKQICDIQPHAHPTHCHAHSLNLCMKDMTGNSKVMEDALDIVREIVLLIKFSPKRESILSNIKENLEMEDDKYEQPAGIAKLSKTRWTVRAICFERILENYDEIMELWHVTLKQGKLESEVKSRIIGCQCQMETFSLFFGLCLGKNLYKHSDNLSKTLQSVKMCALSSFNTAMLTVQVLQNMRNNNFFDMVQKKATAHSFIKPPVLKRKRKLNPRYDYGKADAEFPTSARDNYCRKYYEALDLLISAIKSRFLQHSFQAYQNLETLLLKRLQDDDIEDQTQYLQENFTGDINLIELSAQLPVFKILLHNGDGIVNFDDIVKNVRAKMFDWLCRQHL